MATSVHDRAAVSRAVDSVTGGCTSLGGAQCERGPQVRHATRRAIELNRDWTSGGKNHVRAADPDDARVHAQRCIGGEIPKVSLTSATS